MAKNNNDLKNTLGNRWELFRRLHRLILSLDKGITVHVFPIYIVYCLGEKNIALIYYKGKFVATGGLDVGLNLNKKPKTKRFSKARHMKYPSITYSIKLKKLKDITPIIIKTIKSIKT